VRVEGGCCRRQRRPKQFLGVLRPDTSVSMDGEPVPIARYIFK